MSLFVLFHCLLLSSFWWPPSSWFHQQSMLDTITTHSPLSHYAPQHSPLSGISCIAVCLIFPVYLPALDWNLNCTTAEGVGILLTSGCPGLTVVVWAQVVMKRINRTKIKSAPSQASPFPGPETWAAGPGWFPGEGASSPQAGVS